jgi:uncharacterized phage-associated protein
MDGGYRNPPAAIANEFIKLAKESNRPISPMKLQKLVYFAHGWYLALAGNPLINEPIQAWKFGPVIPSLYHSLKAYGNSPITGHVRNEAETLFEEPEISSIDDGPNVKENEQVKELVKRIWDLYGSFSAVQLSNLTHEPKSPWSTTADRDKKRGVPIDQDKIRDYFLAQAKR